MRYIASRKNILLIIPNLGMGGAQRSFAKIANWLSADHTVIIAVFDDSFTSVYSVEAQIHLLGKKSPKNFFFKGYNFLKRIRSLKRIKKKFKVDITISFLEGASYLNVLSSCGDKKIISVRGSKRYDPHIKGFGRWLRLKILIPLLYKKANKIITASIGLEKEIKESYPILKEITQTIQNGYFIQPYQKPVNDSPYYILVWAGRMGDEKGLLELIDVFNEVRRKDPSFRLLLIGSGPLKPKVLQMGKEKGIGILAKSSLNIKDFESADIINIDFTHEIGNFFYKCDFFILTSPSEGFPNVLLEAMISGLPVISTDCYWGPREILCPSEEYNNVTDKAKWAEYGILMPLLTSSSEKVKQDWVSTIISLKEKNAKELYSFKAWERSNKFDEKVISQKWLDLIKEITQK